MCVTLGTDGDDSGTPTIAWLLARLLTLSGERLRYLAGPRLLMASVGLGTALLIHRRCLNAWSNLHVGGLAGILLSVGAPLATLGLVFLWFLDALIASVHSGDHTAARFFTSETTLLYVLPNYIIHLLLTT